MGGVNSLCIGRCHDSAAADTPENHLHSRHWRRAPLPQPPPPPPLLQPQPAPPPSFSIAPPPATSIGNGHAALEVRVDVADSPKSGGTPPPAPLPLPSRPSRWSLREPFGRAGKSHRRNLSAAFSQVTTPEDEEAQQQLRAKFDLLELNTASEEQFMTLPGVNRATAANIVAYRRQIGSFRRVEDLALVAGIGGDKLRLLRPEVYVRQAPAAGATAAAVPVNSANLFQLMRLPGVTQAAAEAIVGYRRKHGPFRSLDEVAAVPGVGGRGLLAGLRGRICLDTAPEEDVAGLPGSPPTSAAAVAAAAAAAAVSPGIGRFSESQLCLLAECRIFDRPYSRPPTCAAFDSTLAGRPTVRIAAWNLNRLSLEKVSNPGVLEVICCTLLENGISIVAVQEVSDPAALQRVCDELNHPTLPSVRRWRGDRGQWDACASESPVGRGFQSAEYGGFLFRAGPRVRFRRAEPLERPGTAGSGGTKGQRAFARSPYVAQLSISGVDGVGEGADGGGVRFLTASLHLKAPGLGGSGDGRTEVEADYLTDLAAALDAVGGPAARCLLLGDFNLAPDHPAFAPLRLLGYACLLGPEEPTNVSRDCPAGSRAYDNLWASPTCKRHFTGQAAVVRSGLFHPLIPASWSFGGPVSDHCPVYAEFYTDTV